MNVRKIAFEDRHAWSQYRTALWPDTEDEHRAEIHAFFSGESIDIAEVLVLEPDNGTIAGFIELNIRDFAEGSRRPNVPYVEAWYVDDAFRGKGYGSQLMAAAENWARQQGFKELASDTEVTNTRSIALHQHLGFQETERVVCFLKKL